MVRLFILVAAIFSLSQQAHSSTDWVDVHFDHQPVDSSETLSKKQGLFEIGQFIKLNKNIKLRVQPGKKVLAGVKAGSTFQILGYKFDAATGKRHYRIKVGAKIGYIYGGTSESYTDWAIQSWTGRRRVIAIVGEEITLNSPDLIDLYPHVESTPSNEAFLPGLRVRVLAVEQDKKGKLFYKVKHKRQVGLVKLSDLQDAPRTLIGSNSY